MPHYYKIRERRYANILVQLLTGCPNMEPCMMIHPRLPPPVAREEVAALQPSDEREKKLFTIRIHDITSWQFDQPCDSV